MKKLTAILFGSLAWFVLALVAGLTWLTIKSFEAAVEALSKMVRVG